MDKQNRNRNNIRTTGETYIKTLRTTGHSTKSQNVKDPPATRAPPRGKPRIPLKEIKYITGDKQKL